MHVVLLSFGALLFWFPYASHELMKRAYAAESFRISVDNFGIRLGRLDRELLNETRKMGQALDSIERLHHAVHVCAQAKVPKCLLADQTIEKTLQAEIFAMKARIKWKWLTNVSHARHELKGEAVCGLRREVQAPIVFEKCKICGLSTRIMVLDKNIASVVRICGNEVRALTTKVTLEREGDAWQYALSLVE
ncbi:MAG: hypothetical protein H6617_09945 [Bdellovibrionaceae bacterium]|nr:hypothetical protein [Bdellovibrionales bacterium]MCB9254991.1 hypothetical protein [Pseudobdellovibrionaceae bacterium]